MDQAKLSSVSRRHNEGNPLYLILHEHNSLRVVVHVYI